MEEVKHKPLVSIIVLAYNHLDYTKLCIESLYKYTSHIDFELITVNNGSTDGTKEYFNSLPNTKKINFAQNMGGDKPVNEGIKLAEGEFTLFLSNDLILTQNWLDNLLKCIMSNEKIGMVVPVCSYSSNYQQINFGYDSLEKMQETAKQYNVSNPRKWDERLRLVTYTFLIRTELINKLGGIDEAYSPGGFEDDDLSFRVRRAGYKLILARDTFIHHFGSATYVDDYMKTDLLMRNRNIFYNKFGVDTWAVSEIDFGILNLINFNKQKDINILGIGSSCGSTILQMKNLFREIGVTDVKLWYLTEEERYLTDLKTLCDDAICEQTDKLLSLYKENSFDYIIVESSLQNFKNPDTFLNNLAIILKQDGQLIYVDIDKTENVKKYHNTTKNKTMFKNVLLYPGYDFWLNNKIFEDNNIGNFLGVDVGKNSLGILRDEFNKRGYKLCTIDKENISNAEYIIFCDVPKSSESPFFKSIYHMVQKGQIYLDECKKKKANTKMVLLLLEPKFVMPENYDKNIHDSFDIIFTYNDDLVDNNRYFKYRYSQPANVANIYERSFGQKKLCTLVSSNKFSNVPGELFSERRRAIDYFERNHIDEFDFYGNSWQNMGYKSYKGRIAGKLEALSQYKFCICYENGIQNGYITEKIFDCFFSGCIPIYLGAPNVTDYIPKNTFVDRRAFMDYDELYSFIKGIDENRFNEYLNNIKSFLNSPLFEEFTHQYFAQNFISALNKI